MAQFRDVDRWMNILPIKTNLRVHVFASLCKDAIKYLDRRLRFRSLEVSPMYQ